MNPTDTTPGHPGRPQRPRRLSLRLARHQRQAGADTTQTNGNNVDAYLDVNATNSGIGPRPNGGKSLTFDSPIDLTQDPTTYSDAATTNLFYLDNVAHDVLYKYGFDEAAGNFQLNDYGKGGVGGDPVFAEDESGSQHRTVQQLDMATPPDGQSPVQSMYLFNQTFTGNTLTPRRDGSLDATVAIHEINHGTNHRLTGGPSLANGLQTVQSGGMDEGWADWYALMFTQLATDGESTPRPIANYAFGLPDSATGIRTFPYAYDMSIDPRTIGDLQRRLQRRRPTTRASSGPPRCGT